ncbi:MAG: ATP-dependent helicase Lhr and Lhr-like helicase, partial [Miltoncostaeaceae bacterium]|nr:ATP-dependent helicase Lhr and Lhr-like helicase [Miltoncostaeaceae bacterium]
LYLREEAPLLGPPPADPGPGGEAADALRAALAAGARFWDDLARAVPAGREEAFAALWGLVWAGEATNDLWLPLRAPRRLPPAPRAPVRPGRRPGGARRGGLSPVAGRWSLASTLFEPAPAGPDRRRALAEVLLERHGVLTRAAVLAEGIPGGFSGIYTELGDLETLGVCRRGYFVAGLGGAQFALPGAVERLRSQREDAPASDVPEVLVLGAADPAQPYGAALPWPRREGTTRSPSRIYGAQVALVDGVPALYLERGGRGLLTFTDDDRALDAAIAALAAWVTGERRRRAAIERVDGAAALGTPWEARLAAHGWRSDLRAMILRA